MFRKIDAFALDTFEDAAHAFQKIFDRGCDWLAWVSYWCYFATTLYFDVIRFYMEKEGSKAIFGQVLPLFSVLSLVFVSLTIISFQKYRDLSRSSSALSNIKIRGPFIFIRMTYLIFYFASGVLLAALDILIGFHPIIIFFKIIKNIAPACSIYWICCNQLPPGQSILAKIKTKIKSLFARRQSEGAPA